MFFRSDNKTNIKKLLASADITVNGKRPWDIQVNNDNFYSQIIHNGTLGAGESYMAEDWECKRIDMLVDKLRKSQLTEKIKKNKTFLFQLVLEKLINRQRQSKAFEVGQKHYDLGNDLFKIMLGRTMAYTCAYWKTAQNLDEAQEAKLDLVCKKLYLKPGMRVLDIGGGFGSFAKHAAQKYKVSMVNISISKEQTAFANLFCKGLPVENRLQDYREINEQFDRIVSIGMFEAVGLKNYKTFMEVVAKNLKEDGIFLLHTIGRHIPAKIPDPWITKYIFPNGRIPSLQQTIMAIEGVFILEDLHNFGADYDKTLIAWFRNFDKNWPTLKKNYSTTFYRMWKFYLLTCAGSFRARDLQLWQIVLSKKGIVGGYIPVR